MQLWLRLHVTRYPGRARRRCGWWDRGGRRRQAVRGGFRHGGRQQQSWARHDPHSPQPAAMGWSQTALKRQRYLHQRHLWHIQTNSGFRHQERTSGQGPKQTVPIINMGLPVPLFNLPLSCCVLHNLFWSSRVTKPVRFGGWAVAVSLIYPHKIPGYLYPSKHQVK